LQTIFEVTKRMADKMDDMHGWLKPKVAHGMTELFLEAMPAPLARIYGRDQVIDNIVRVITTKEKPRVVIHGAGGMGKTSVSVAVMENGEVGRRFEASHRFWVPCIGAKTPMTFLDILSKSLRVAQNTGDPLKDLLLALEASKEPHLILLDNFETAWSLSEDLIDGGRISVERILNLLASMPHLAILVTIRSNTLPSDTIDWTLVPLEGVTRDAARDIFASICSSARDHPGLDQLLDALGYMPYAVTLLAKQAAKSGLFPDQLLEQWQRHGPNSLSSDLKRKMTTSIAYSVDSPSMSDNPDAQMLLAILCRLPSGTDSKHLKWWAHGVDNLSSAIATLSDTALITQRQADFASTYFVLPVVQSYLNKQPLYNSPRTRSLVLMACCKFVFDHKSSPGNEHFKEHQDALTIEETNILSVLLAVTTASFSEPGYPVEAPVVFDAILAFCWFHIWKKPSPELLKHLLVLVSPDSDTRSLRYMAEARFCLGKTYLQLSLLSEACIELEAARECFRKLGTSSDIIRAGDSALELATSWSLKGQPGDRIEKLIKEAQADLKDDPKGAARALMSLGYNYWYMRMRPQALEQLEIAKAALQKLNCKMEVARCLDTIVRCYASRKATPQWMPAAQDSVTASRLVGTNDLIAGALHTLSQCHIVLEQYDDALIVLKEALVITEELGDLSWIAQIFELSGYTYAKKKDFVGALKAYEEAKKFYSSAERTPRIERHHNRCGMNIHRISESDSQDIELDPPVLY
jgi:tetratricopeptide (TPR) repeat protein